MRFPCIHGSLFDFLLSFVFFYLQIELFLLAGRIVYTCSQKHFCLQIETNFSLSNKDNL